MIRGALFNRCLATSPPGLRRFAHRHRRRVSTVTSDPNNYDHFFRYTSGRWLWDEEQQLKDRFTPFNVRELKRIAAQSVGANECVDMTKLAEGSFNKIFRLSMDNGRAAIVRVPHPIAGPKYLTTASEVATMDFVRSLCVSHYA